MTKYNGRVMTKGMNTQPQSYALQTDRYELTMLDALVQAGRAEKRSVFEVFSRDLPNGRPFGVFSGINRFLPKIDHFSFDDEILRFLKEEKIVSKDTLDYLSSFRFNGDITSYHEGEIYFPNSPVVTVEATLGEALLLETLILSTINFDSAISSAAVRIVLAAKGKFVMEAGSRRVDPEAAVNAARAAYIGGAHVTSNLEAGRKWGIPTAGTASHAFTLSFPSELEAFENQSKYLSENSIFLVDTYDIETGIRNAVKASNSKLKGIRIDSGDLVAASKTARKLLDELGAPQAQIMVSGDLDEFKILDLSQAPIDAFESGHKLVTGSGAASAGFVYKLVATESHPKTEKMVPVEKKSEGKRSLGGKKIAKRKLRFDGIAIEESIFLDQSVVQNTLGNAYRDLQSQIMRSGEYDDLLTVDDARNHLIKTISEIPDEIRLRVNDEPAVPTTVYPVRPHND